MKRIAFAALLLMVAGCTAGPPIQSSICTMHPGSYQCQVEQYENAGN